MELPKTPVEYLFWLGMQFPVVAAVFLAVRWALRWDNRRYTELLRMSGQQNAALLADKDVRIAERDVTIRELKAEIIELKAKLSRSRSRKGGADGGQET